MPNRMSCPHCGTAWYGGANFCGACGWENPAIAGSPPVRRRADGRIIDALIDSFGLFAKSAVILLIVSITGTGAYFFYQGAQSHSKARITKSSEKSDDENRRSLPNKTVLSEAEYKEQKKVVITVDAPPKTEVAATEQQARHGEQVEKRMAILIKAWDRAQFYFNNANPSPMKPDQMQWFAGLRSLGDVEAELRYRLDLEDQALLRILEAALCSGSLTNYQRGINALDKADAILEKLPRRLSTAMDSTRLGWCLYNQLYVSFMRMRADAARAVSAKDPACTDPGVIKSQIGLLETQLNTLRTSLNSPYREWMEFKRPFQDAVTALADGLRPLTLNDASFAEASQRHAVIREPTITCPVCGGAGTVTEWSRLARENTDSYSRALLMAHRLNQLDLSAETAFTDTSGSMGKIIPPPPDGGWVVVRLSNGSFTAGRGPQERICSKCGGTGRLRQ